MKVIILGATGMIGQGVLQQCLKDPRVDAVVTLGRAATGIVHPKLRELVHANLRVLSALEADLRGIDACFYCLGTSSVGMSEADYRRVTLELTVQVARSLLHASPGMSFVFVSGEGTDAKSTQMWARVKAAAEEAVLALPFKSVCAMRPAFIQPGAGIKSRTRLYRILYTLLTPLFPLLEWLFPKYVTTTDRVGRAMINIAAAGAPKRILETSDINAAARKG